MLFPMKAHVAIPESKPLSVATPLGSLLLEASVSGEMLSAFEHNTYRINQDSYIHRWEMNTYEAECALLRVEVAPALTGRVDDTWAGIWRVKALQTQTSGPSTFSCRWQAGFTWTDGGADSGEGLEAQTYSDGRQKVTIGTEDYEYIQRRAERNDFFPRLLKPTEADSLVEYLADGLNIVIPSLLQGETCQLQFVIAWSPETDDIGTWLAVDQPYQDILKPFDLT